MPGEACCDGATPIRDPLDPGDPTLFCPRPCDDRVGQGCGRTCDHAPGTGPTPTSGVYVCTTSGTRCVDVHSARADDAPAVGQISSAMWPDHRYARTDATCDGIDDDCDETADDNFAEATCFNATVPACGGMVFEGELQCPGDGTPARCVAEPGVNYCRFGSDADDDEWDTLDCDQTRTGCCLYTPFTWGSAGAFFCAQRDTDCSPTFCYQPDDTNRDTSAGESCN